MWQQERSATAGAEGVSHRYFWHSVQDFGLVCIASSHLKEESAAAERMVE